MYIQRAIHDLDVFGIALAGSPAVRADH